MAEDFTNRCTAFAFAFGFSSRKSVQRTAAVCKAAVVLGTVSSFLLKTAAACTKALPASDCNSSVTPWIPSFVATSAGSAAYFSSSSEPMLTVPPASLTASPRRFTISLA